MLKTEFIADSLLRFQIRISKYTKTAWAFTNFIAWISVKIFKLRNLEKISVTEVNHALIRNRISNAKSGTQLRFDWGFLIPASFISKITQIRIRLIIIFYTIFIKVFKWLICIPGPICHISITTVISIRIPESIFCFKIYDIMGCICPVDIQ